MRKETALGVGAGVVVVGAAITLQRRRRGVSGPVTGTFSNGVAFARLGRGSKSLLWIGGPSVGAPGGMYLTMMGRVLRPFVQQGYTVWVLGLKPHLPEGCTISDMANDYAQLIAEEFNGHVDVVIGDSTGGLIGFCLAARHPAVFGHIVIAVAAHTMTAEGKAANLRYAELLAEGRKTDAAAALVALMYPGVRPRWVSHLLARMTAWVSLSAAYDAHDVVVGAEAVNAFDGQELLPEIGVPVLVVCGDRDRWFAPEAYRETADLIPDCTLKVYEGKDHLGAMFDRRLPRDVLDFVSQPGAHSAGGRVGWSVG